MKITALNIYNKTYYYKTEQKSLFLHSQINKPAFDTVSFKRKKET